MMAWLVTSVWQMWTYKRHQRVHNSTGHVAVAILGYCVVEMLSNAVFTFLPSKPALLAQAVLRRQDVQGWEIAVFTGYFAVGLIVPIMMSLHGWQAYPIIRAGSLTREI